MRRLAFTLQALVISASLVGSAGEAAAGQPTKLEQLERAARALPDVRGVDADVAAQAALLASDGAVSPELLLAIAWGESRFITRTVTYRACGLVQVVARSKRECALLRVPVIGMLVGRLQLEAWLRIAYGNLRLALLANACGVSAFRGGCTKTRWPGWVLRRARRIERLEAQLGKKATR